MIKIGETAMDTKELLIVYEKYVKEINDIWRSL